MRYSGAGAGYCASAPAAYSNLFKYKAGLSQVNFVAGTKGNAAAGVGGDFDAPAVPEYAGAERAAIIVNTPFAAGRIEPQVGM